MQRRRVLLGIAGLWLVAPLGSRGQSGKVRRVGLLDAGERHAWWAAFRKQMNELGYIEGKNIAFEARFAHGRLKELPALVQDLLRLQVDAIVTASTEAAIAASRATEKVPIITATGADHVSHGLAVTLAKPGGNVTGLTSISPELTGKRVELLREIHPKLARLAILWQSDNAGSMTSMRDLQGLTTTSGMSLQNVGVRRADEIPAAFAAASEKGAEALYVTMGPLTYGERRTIGALALKHRLPTMHTTAEMVEAGGLVGYGTDYPDLFRRAAVYVDRILKGAKPGDLPIEQPSKFDLVINLRTAKALGITIPPALLLRASRVID